LDTKIRTREDATSATSGLVVLGAIPHIRAPAPAKNGKNGTASIAADRGIARLVTRDEPLHPVAEAYRALRTSITFTSVKGAPQVLVFTSALPGDGKTTSASNLAVSMVQQGLRTLLVDADLRRGFLHKILEAEQQPGLTHLLAGQSNLDDAIQAVKVTDADQPLHFLSSGAFPPHPAELLGSDRMKDLVAQMRTRYEVVVFDAPPLNLVTDAAILGTIADATILVARAGVTDRRDLHHAAQQLRQLHAPLAGLVLNAFDVAKHGGYGYGYGYGYGGYGVRNGSGHGND
jgi:capsular exopolysaccharide synthesis family protein